ncbi:hypothetical protein [Clostridium beijerinckii]|uniref:Uncharacterized protein n=1 Tax=Clostridium beijerinckii TaxID=1520 RepID=A0A1S9N5Z5_CLOBE|nr:hypothetical protein [Clostridium beijerinckii]OOP72811.1 hypothetical protein CBEIBR21_13405 [Clostridium beijerinckii]
MSKNQNSNEISNITNPLSALQNPGDNMSARVTDSNRKVLKVETGNTKYSATQYPNGTIVETKTTKKK